MFSAKHRFASRSAIDVDEREMQVAAVDEVVRRLKAEVCGQ
jgi:hypothetical protein